MTTTDWILVRMFPQMSSLLLQHNAYFSDESYETWISVGVLHLVVILVSGGFLIVLQQLYSKRRCRDFGVPVLYNTPQGRAYPIIGHGITFLKHTPWNLLTAWHRNSSGHDDDDKNDDATTCRPSRPIVGFPLLGTTMFSVASPSLCKAILQSHVGHVHKDIEVTMKPFLSILGTGMVSSEGQHWLQQRLRLSHAFRRDILERIPIHTLTAVQRLCRKLDEAAAAAAKESNPDASKVPIGSLLRHLTLQVISASFLSLTAEESDMNFAVLYLPIVEEANLRIWYPYRTYNIFSLAFWQYHYNVYRLNAYVSGLIRQRWTLRRQEQEQQRQLNNQNQTRKPSRPVDMLDTMLHVYEKINDNRQQDGTTPAPSTLSPTIVRQVRDEMKTFMLAGHETSAAMMTWTLYELMCSKRHGAAEEASNGNGNNGCHSQTVTPVAKRINWMDRVVSEANDVFNPATVDWCTTATVDNLPPPERLAELALTEASLKESLRKYSVVPIVARRIVQDLHLDEGPYFLPKGSSVMINIQAVHLDPNIWPQPMKYDPTRFLTEDDTQNDANTGNDSNLSISESKMNKPIQPFTFLPFIAGPRNCLGQHLALLESKMVIALLTQRYDFQFLSSSAHQIISINPEDWTLGKDPRHPFMVPVIPKDELLVTVNRKD